MIDKKSYIDEFRIFLENLGINPLYFSTIVCIIVVISYWQQFKNWDKIETWRKGLALSPVFAAIVFSVLSLLNLIGFINFNK
jgi:hypothetical protein